MKNQIIILNPETGELTPLTDGKFITKAELERNERWKKLQKDEANKVRVRGGFIKLMKKSWEKREFFFKNPRYFCIFYVLCRYLSINDNVCLMGFKAFTRRMLKDATGYSYSTIDRALIALKKEKLIGLVRRGERYYYCVNPEYAMLGENVSADVLDAFVDTEDDDEWLKILNLDTQH